MATDLGSRLAVEVVTAVLAVTLAIRRHCSPAVALFLARLGELGCETITKHLLARPRPALERALATADGVSFPFRRGIASAARRGADRRRGH
ncbi:hypothetical protein ACFQ34_09195 [Pseudonocardia benzenivorans]|uniref:Secreted protein n=1 Tax=Pseudonocardia benzenivorans TaxID=228005 RepID=A0ABW3VFF1_9PSEU